MKRLFFIVLIAACDGAKDKPLPTGDSGTGPTDPSLMCPGFDQERWHLTGATSDGQVRYVLDRCARTTCAGGCQIFEVSFSLTYNGRTDWAKGRDVAYEKTHHNYDDSLIATLPDRALKWRVAIDDANQNLKLRYYVRVDTRDGDPILAETEIAVDQCLPPTSCGV